jgi:tetratricopeptide (TPR) repeat protein
MDDVAMVFLRNVPQNRPWIDRLQIDCDSLPLARPGEASRVRLYDFYSNSGALLLTLRRGPESEAALRQASQIFPADPNSHILLAGLYRLEGKLPAAEQELLTALSLNESSGALFSLGDLYAMEGRNTEAVQAVRRAAESSAQPLDMYMYLARLQLRDRRPEQALAALDGAEQSSPFRKGGESLAPELYAQIAEGRSEAHEALGHWPQALSLQEEATRRTPKVARRWARLAFLFRRTGQDALAAQAQRNAQAFQVQSHD